jgi:hypothetical protein
MRQTLCDGNSAAEQSFDRSGGSASLKVKGKRQKEKDFAPPGQLRRYAATTHMENSPRLMVELVWEDADLEELAIVADNGQYRGVATAYFGRGDVALMANALRGFPKLISQREIFSGGSEEADNSFAQLVF